MLKRFWQYSKKPKNIPYAFTTFLVFVLAAVRLFHDYMSIDKLVALILVVLAAMAAVLLVSNETMLRVEGQMDGPTVGKLLHTFDDIREEIKQSIETADQVWLLSRTGRGWWRNHGNEIQATLEKDKENSRLLFLDPSDGALQMIVNSAKQEWNKKDTFLEFQNNVVEFLEHLCQIDGIPLRVIDHLPAWTLLVINPKKRNKKSVIYVELATYHSGSKARPVFKVTLKDLEYFEMFIDEFEKMWKAARPLIGPRQARSLKNAVNLDKAVRTYEEFKDEIREALGNADHIWLLSRTGLGWWKEYEEQLDSVLERNKAENRFVFLNPENGALRMVANSAWPTFYDDDPLERRRPACIKLLNSLSKDKGLEPKIIDHLPACTILIINPKSKNDDAIIFVEIATFRSDSGKRPAFKINSRDEKNFMLFKNEYEQMWNTASPWARRGADESRGAPS